MAKKFVIWDDETKELGAASSFRRQWIRDFFSSPFWDNIPDKPSAFPPEAHASTHAKGGSDELSLDASQITSGVLSVDRIPSLSRSKITDFFNSPFWSNIPDRPKPYSYDISSDSYTVGAGAETTLLSKSGEGYVTILYKGDGSTDLRIRVYVDGSLDDEFPCNEVRVGAYAFTSSIVIKLYNPSANSVTGNCPTLNIRGWVR